MIQLMDANDTFVTAFDAREQNGDAGGWLAARRREAIAAYRAAGLPSVRDEDWKYTNLRALAKHEFRPADRSSVASVSRERVEEHEFSGLTGSRLVFVNGHFAAELSQLGDLPDGATIRGLTGAFDAVPAVEPLFSSVVPERSLVALNTAFVQGGAILDVAPGVVVDEPVHLLFLSAANGEEPAVGAYTRVLVRLGRGARLSLVEDYAEGLPSERHFTNAVTEIALAANADLDHVRVVREGADTIHVSSTAIDLARDSRFVSNVVCTGGALVRNNVDATLDDEGAECTLNGLVAIGGRQHVDNQTRIVHAKPHCNSWEMYKHILRDECSAAFNGKIFVAEDAQKTDAKQTNQTLLLSPDAVMNSKPELEIYADDVRCTHGATIGELEREPLFYLRTRGIDTATAQSLLTYAFACEVLNGIRIAPVRTALQSSLFAQLPGESPVAVAEG